MKLLNRYIQICKFFHDKKVPKIKFREIKEIYKIIYKERYGIDEEDVNKATFFLFFFCFFIIMVLFSIFLINLNFIFVTATSLIISSLISYRFTTILTRVLSRLETRINVLLNFIKIDFALVQKTLKPNSDYCLNFILLMTYYKGPLSNVFKEIIKKIHEGAMPEEQISHVVTPSSDFNEYLNDLILCNFKPNKIKKKSKKTLSKKILRYL